MRLPRASSPGRTGNSEQVLEGRHDFACILCSPWGKHLLNYGHRDYGHREMAPAYRPIRTATDLKQSRMKKAKNKTSQAATMRLNIERAIRSIPRGKVCTYGGIAKLAGYAGAARLVARV